MSSFFTLPASQKKRKRPQGDGASRENRQSSSKARQTRDESISGSESEDEGPTRPDEEYESSNTEDDEFADEDPAAKRIRLAEQYLANTQKEVLDEAGFDAKDVDEENLRRRMGDRLKEDTAETKGKLYRWIAQEFDWGQAGRSQFRHHQKAVTGVAISGDFAYTGGRDGILVKWRLPPKEREANKSRKPQRLLVSRRFGKNTNSSDPDHHTKAIYCVAASQDGKFVATGGADKKLIIWDANTLKPLKTFFQHRDSVLSLAFRRGTNQLFSASKDRTVKIWSLDELTYVETLFGHQDEVVDASALAQEKCITVGARDRTARLWKVVEETQLVFRGGGAPKKSRSADSAVDIPDDPPHEGSTDRIACLDDETFITGSDNGSLSLWNIHKKKAVHVYPLAHGMDPPLPLEAVSAEEIPAETARPKPQARWITALRAIPFSDVFVSGSWDGAVRVWKISADKRVIEPVCSLEGEVEGIVNDVAIVDRGDRGKDGVMVVAAVGKEHRLARWREFKDGKNYAVLWEIPRKTLANGAEEEEEEEQPEEDFAGFD